MNDEQSTSGSTVNPAAEAHAPRQAAPVMDVVPPPTSATPPAAPAVVAAPPELPNIPQISDDIAQQIAAQEAALPPQDLAAPVSEPPSVTEAPVEASDEVDKTTEAVDAGDSPSELIQAEAERESAAAAVALTQAAAPKVANPAQTAIIVTVFIMIILAAVTIFAYLSTKK